MTTIYQLSADDLRTIIREEVERAVCCQAIQQPVDADASGHLMTRQEVAEYLRISPSTVNNYVKNGMLKKVLIGARSVRYRTDQVHKLGGGVGWVIFFLLYLNKTCVYQIRSLSLV